MLPLTRLKILFYTREGPDDAGYEIRSFDIVENLKNIFPFISLFSFKSLYSGEEKSLTFLKKIYYNICAFKKLWKMGPNCLILQRVNYHIPAALLYCLFKRPFLILDLDDWEIRESYLDTQGKSKSLAYTLTTWLCSKASMTIFSSEFLYKTFKDFCRKTTLLPSYICKRNFKFYPVVQPKLTVLWAGAVPSVHPETQKELLEFAKTFKSFANPDLNLIYLLRGDQAEETALLLADLHIPSLTLLTHIPRNEMNNYYAEAHFGILPLFTPTFYNLSKSPVKLFEYMTCGLIPVVSALGEGQRILSSLQIGHIAGNYEQMVKILNDYSGVSQNKREEERQKISKVAEKKFSADPLKIQWKNLILTTCKSLFRAEDETE